MTAHTLQRLIWATRGKTWGFRFLRDGGEVDPLPVYEAAFYGTGDGAEVWLANDDRGALRFPDPLERRDRSGRVIPHEFVIYGPLCEEIRSADEGRRLVWPLVAEDFNRVWNIDLP